jgi:hypothetical protein
MNLLRVVEDRNLRTRMAEAGWAHVHDRYHYTRLVEDTAKLYRALTA